jgi:hypothetical protein
MGTGCFFEAFPLRAVAKKRYVRQSISGVVEGAILIAFNTWKRKNPA